MADLPAGHEIRACEPSESDAILAVINDAAMAYRGVIPEDRWHDPYMSRAYLQGEIADGVAFVCYLISGNLVGVMGVQDRGAVELVRHAYVRTELQGFGIGSALLKYLKARSKRQLLVGTWAAASWAIAFYERHGFRAVPRAEIATVLQRYWDIPARQVETSVVLACPPLSHD